MYVLRVSISETLSLSPLVLQLDRLKDLTRRDAEEQAKKAKRVEDRKVITEQIEARQRAKLIQLEAREQVIDSSWSLTVNKSFRTTGEAERLKFPRRGKVVVPL